MSDEEWVWIEQHANPREIDPDLVLDLSAYGRYRFLQVQRWRRDPRMFLMRDIIGMSSQDVLLMRRKELLKQMKEGTQDERTRSEGQAED